MARNKKLLCYLLKLKYIDRYYNRKKLQNNNYIERINAKPLGKTNNTSIYLNKDKINSDLILHVGFGHCATSSLQNYFFPNIDGIKYLGKPFINNEINLAYCSLCYHKKNFFKLEKTRRIFIENLDKDYLNVISAEGFTTSGIGIYGESHIGCIEILNRLDNVFKGVKIKVIFTIRSQVDLLRAHYFQFWRGLKQKGINYPTKERWLLDQFDKHDRMTVPMQNYFFNQVINEYSETFGHDNVLILPLEVLKINKELYFQELYSFMELDYDENNVKTFQKTNVTKKIDHFDDHYRDLITSYYNDDNDKLFNNFDIICRDEIMGDYFK